MSEKLRDTTVLFSGGRDSSLAACLLANSGLCVHLLTCNNGASFGCDLPDYRASELATVFGDRIANRTVASTIGLFRRIALADIEDDFSKYKTNLIVLGSQLAMHSEAIVYCIRNSIKSVATGFATYQSDYPEQRPEAIAAFREFLGEFNLAYSTPVYEYPNADVVKYQLLDFGITTKSLEAVSIFSDTFSSPSTDQVTRYIEAKLDVCRAYVRLKCNIPS